MRAVEWADLLYLLAVRALRDELTPKARNEFYEALKRVPLDRAREVRFGRLTVAIDDLKTEVHKRAKDWPNLVRRSISVRTARPYSKARTLKYIALLRSSVAA